MTPDPRVRSFLSVLALGVVTTMTAPPAAGQSRSILELLDTGDRTIVPGEIRVGELSAADWRSVNDSYLQAWSLTVTIGQTVYIDLISDDFDAYLYLTGPGLDETLSDDDGGGACHARLAFAPPENGAYLVVVSGLRPGSTGSFTLRVDTEAGPVNEEGCGVGTRTGVDVETLAQLDPQGRQLILGTESVGSLSDADRTGDGEALQSWAFIGDSGTAVTFDLISPDFDTFLYLVSPSLDLQSNDDDGGACNARITTVLAETGEYRVIASAFSNGSGEFTLRASPETPPLADGPCPGSEPDLDPEALFAMPLAGPPLAVGDTVTGMLTDRDALLHDAYVQVFEHVATAGRAFTVDLRSEAFDAFLFVAAPELADYAQDDDGGGACHARVTIVPSESGPYRIVATSIGLGTGEFTLSVSEQPGPMADGLCGGGDEARVDSEIPLEELDAEGRTLEIGNNVTGEITDADWHGASVYQAWEFTATAGDSVTVDLSSDTFDTYLYLLGPGIAGPLTDDDGGDLLNSRISTRLPSSGVYRVIVSMIGQDTGFFTLNLLRN